MADWDETGPADDDIVSQFPADERAARAAVKSNFGVDHHETDDADVGKHEVIQVMDNAADPTIASGQVGIWNNGGVAFMREGAGTPRRLDVIPSGTVMIFFQASPPVGWSDTGGGIVDALLRLVSPTGSAGGTTSANSWTISGITTNNHALTISQMPAHDHGNTGTAGGHTHTGNTNNDTHSHGGGSSMTASTDTSTASTFRIVSGATTAGANSGSLVDFATDSDTHNHSLNINSVSGHTHDIPSQGSGSGHNHGVSHDGNWRPPVNNVIRAQKD